MALGTDSFAKNLGRRRRAIAIIDSPRTGNGKFGMKPAYAYESIEELKPHMSGLGQVQTLQNMLATGNYESTVLPQIKGKQAKEEAATKKAALNYAAKVNETEELRKRSEKEKKAYEREIADLKEEIAELKEWVAEDNPEEADASGKEKTVSKKRKGDSLKAENAKLHKQNRELLGICAKQRQFIFDLWPERLDADNSDGEENEPSSSPVKE